MATLAAARSVFRSIPARTAAARLGSEAKSATAGARSPFSATSLKQSSLTFRYRPISASICVETLAPYHTAIASAMMTSLLTVSRTGYGWLPEASNDDV